MKQRPILFSTLMVQAILAGRKNQTRREVKVKNYTKLDMELSRCPYGQSGDVLWVRETYFPVFKHIHAPLFHGQGKYMYKADMAFIGEHKWKPSIHMPKAAARIWLQITNVRVERLQDISQEDAISEGIEKHFHHNTFCNYKNGKYELDAKYSYLTLWEKINGPESRNANPWVWVLEFQPIANPNS